jgi:hypothetical protein
MDILRAIRMREAAGYLAHDFKEGLACTVHARGGLRYVIDQDASDRLATCGGLFAGFVFALV